MVPLLFSTLAFAAVVGDGLPAANPTSVGMSAARLAKIDHVIERGIRAGGYPGAAVVVGRRGAAVWEKGFGRLGWNPSDPAVSENTIYDLASLTKVVGTATAVMLLFDEGKVKLDEPVGTYLPDFSGGDKDRVTVRMLLEHRSGLPAGRELWRIASSPADARRAVLETPLEFAPGRYVQYSDIGADVLALMVERVSGSPLDAFLTLRVFQPLGMTETMFRPSPLLRSRIAPTELNPPRGYSLRGEVHDENAFALGGVAGHAGLFGTASDLSVFAQMMLNGGEFEGTRLIRESTVSLFTRRSAGTRALGWDTCGGQGSCGKYLSDRAYGHTGFTGTSLWIDPDRDMFVILLTNRVHAARAKRPATVIGDVRADLSDAAALAVTDDPDGVLAMPKAFRADKAVGWNKPVRPVRKSSVRKKSVRPKAAVTQAGKATSSKSTASKSTASKSTASKSTASKSTASKSAASKSTTAKSTASKSSASKSTASKPSTSKAKASSSKTTPPKKKAPARK
ncbi:MAG TPA: serine hydrolase [Gemmatimonadaceae bacterium]|nr:serine hydrolase [Gemmatimonadaceae bacterium]